MAANVVIGNSTLSLSATQTLTTGLITTQKPQGAMTFGAGGSGAAYTNGTGAGQIDQIYQRQLTFVASTLQTIDLTALPDMASPQVNQSLARVRELWIEVTDIVLTHTLSVAQGASNGWAFLPPIANGLTAMPGGRAGIVMSDPDSVGAGVGMVVDGSHKTITLTPSAFPIIVNVTILGCSAVS
jgi:hypothetical protein